MNPLVYVCFTIIGLALFVMIGCMISIAVSHRRYTKAMMRRGE